MENNSVKKKISLLIIIMVLLSAKGFADEIRTWKDNKGVLTISNKIPPDNVKIISESKYIRSDQGEIERYEIKRKQRIINEEIFSAEHRRANESAEERIRLQRQTQDQAQLKEQKLKNAVDIERERLAKSRNNSGSKFASDWNSTINSRTKELTNDPDQYFSDKEKRKPIMVIDPNTGHVIPGIPIR